jgi:glycosyltransferase involved in cell wall biosynthesis
MSDIPKTLFLGLGASAVSYYRCFLPAITLGAEYVTWAAAGPDRDVVLTGGLGNPPPTLDDLTNFEVVVIQYATGRSWLKRIRALQDTGVTVLYEIDDYVHSTHKSKTHELAKGFTKDRVKDLEMGMRTADGMICSTSWLAGRYRSFNRNTWECRNGIDLNRYSYKRPDRHGMVTIGFAGGVGHKASLARWEPALRSVMRQRENVRFVSVGAPAAAAFVEEFGRDRAITYNSATIEVYPASMTIFDISFAPSAENNQFRGKSDLRWLETAALGIPLIAHPDVYPDIEDGVTGVHARDQEEVEAAFLRLIDDADERERIGRQAQEHVKEHRRIEIAAESWAEVLREARAGARASIS